MPFALSKMQLESTAFEPGGKIPKKHTGEGEDLSPAFHWSHVPEGTKSLALVCHDPDAPRVEDGQYGFVHWVLYNIPGNITEVPEGVDNYTLGVHSRNEAGYMGPMPPQGHGAHRYFFMLYALDEQLMLPAGLTLWQLLKRIEPHLLATNRLVGTYERAL